MFWHKLSSSLHPAALALTLTAALPAFAQNETESSIKASQAHGRASGAWVPASPGTPGAMHGRMVDMRGHLRFEIHAITHAIVPSEIPDYEIGSLCGRLISARLQDEGVSPAKDDTTKPQVEPASIYVLGKWSVHQTDGAGRFTGVAYVEIAPLPMPLVLLDIGGVFQIPVKNAAAKLPLGGNLIAPPPPAIDEPKLVVCYAGPGLFTMAERLATLAVRAADSEHLKSVDELIAPANLPAHGVRFQARWKTRN